MTLAAAGTGSATSILAINCVLATVAGVVNLWTATHTRAPAFETRLMRRIRGVMALAFAATYAAHLTGVIGFTDRVYLGKALALWAWPIVWILPALVTIPPMPAAETAKRIVAEVQRRVRESE